MNRDSSVPSSQESPIRTAITLALALVSTTAFAGPSGVIFPAWPGVAAGPSGTSSARFVAEQAVPVNSVELMPTVAFSDSAFQWYHVPLTVPVSDDAGRVADVTVCFKTNSTANTAFISQVRMTQQLVPGPASVVLDDGTNLTAPTGRCYTATPLQPITPGGVLQLSLKLVMDDLDDSIEVSGGYLRMVAR